jgi:homoserine acetyltransferase
MGGYQVLEWCLMEPGVIQSSFVITTSAAESAWGIAIHTAQRLAIEADQTWKDRSADAGKNGIKAARGIGMLTYRNYKIFHQKQSDPDFSKLIITKLLHIFFTREINYLIVLMHRAIGCLQNQWIVHNIAREDLIHSKKRYNKFINPC